MKRDICYYKFLLKTIRPLPWHQAVLYEDDMSHLVVTNVVRWPEARVPYIEQNILGDYCCTKNHL